MFEKETWSPELKQEAESYVTEILKATGAEGEAKEQATYLLTTTLAKIIETAIDEGYDNGKEESREPEPPDWLQDEP